MIIKSGECNSNKGFKYWMPVLSPVKGGLLTKVLFGWPDSTTSWISANAVFKRAVHRSLSSYLDWVKNEEYLAVLLIFNDIKMLN